MDAGERWSIPGGAAAGACSLLSPHTRSASQVGGAGASMLSQLWDKAGEAPQAQPGVSPLPTHSGHPQAAGGGPSTAALPGTANPSPLIPFHRPCSSPTCPVLWP